MLAMSTCVTATAANFERPKGLEQDVEFWRKVFTEIDTNQAYLHDSRHLEVVYEVVQMAGLKGYKTGGTIHIVVNNQIGFTTNYIDGRTSTYCTDVGKVTLCPIFHVNGDDVEMVTYAVQLAMEYRQLSAKELTSIKTLGELKKAGYHPIGIKDELRNNLISALKKRSRFLYHNPNNAQLPSTQ